MNVCHEEQKRARLKKFLNMLSQDTALMNYIEQEPLRSLTQLLHGCGYDADHQSVNIAEVVSSLLQEQGSQSNSLDMMEHVLNGGTVDQFMHINVTRHLG
jgi:hypothetical protein